ncbi:MAG: hypothetical protein IIC84_08130 [Chloroflexi bacterium]|nr:hypothetical protein [Chloroflexota bacterium]
MVHLKDCPRCRGDMYTERDIYGTYKECLQCGHMIDLPKPGKIISEALIAEAKKEAA